MSRIGKLPVKINTATVEEKEGFFFFTGSQGTVKVPHIKGIDVEIKDKQINVKPQDLTKDLRSKWGLQRSLLQGGVTGVETGFEKNLEMQGVGFRATASGKLLEVNAGYSHPIKFQIPEGITVSVTENTKINVKGADKQQVGQVAAEIRKIRKPEPYKGKGIRYSNEVVRRKPGKSGKAEGA
jgi:large subunit ribosomal protein L6